MKQSLFLCCLIFSTVAFSQKKIPNSTLRTLDGKFVNIQDEISNDKITVLSFWATWCVPVSMN